MCVSYVTLKSGNVSFNFLASFKHSLKNVDLSISAVDFRYLLPGPPLPRSFRVWPSFGQYTSILLADRGRSVWV